MLTIHSVPSFIRSRFGNGKLRVFLALFFVFVATPQLCAQSDKGEIHFTTILHSPSSGIGYSLDRVIYNQDDWQAFWNEVNAGSSLLPPTPEIDFSKRMVIIAAMGLQPTPRHFIKITRIERVKTMVKVSIEETQPGKGCSPLGVVTHPIHIVETDQLSSVTFRRAIGISRCGVFD
ncbi:MAG TPA: protease complex subunit PrcB family protein [Blastocatellia bacterium]|nr:protease complex subunit PrcB family protein [Blastocatellia bacterium]